MFQTPEVFTMAAAMAENAAARMSGIARNVANADTPGYHAKTVADFASSYRAQSSFQLATSRPGHMASSGGALVPKAMERAGGHMSPNGNTVSLEDEMMAAAVVRQDHETALAIYRKSLDILRASLGRR